MTRPGDMPEVVRVPPLGAVRVTGPACSSARPVPPYPQHTLAHALAAAATHPSRRYADDAEPSPQGCRAACLAGDMRQVLHQAGHRLLFERGPLGPASPAASSWTTSPSTPPPPRSPAPPGTPSCCRRTARQAQGGPREPVHRTPAPRAVHQDQSRRPRPDHPPPHDLQAAARRQTATDPDRQAGYRRRRPRSNAPSPGSSSTATAESATAEPPPTAPISTPGQPSSASAD